MFNTHTFYVFDKKYWKMFVILNSILSSFKNRDTSTIKYIGFFYRNLYRSSLSWNLLFIFRVCLTWIRLYGRGGGLIKVFKFFLVYLKICIVREYWNNIILEGIDLDIHITKVTKVTKWHFKPLNGENFL